MTQGLLPTVLFYAIKFFSKHIYSLQVQSSGFNVFVHESSFISGCSMKQAYQTLLLVGQTDEAIDSIIDACNQADLPPIKISTAFNADYASELLSKHDFSLLIVAMSESLPFTQLKQLAEQHGSRPTMAVLSATMADDVLQALRSGACDVFVKAQIDAQAGDFAAAVCKLLHQARLIEKNFQYREALEKSLNELQIDQQAARQIQQNMLPDKTVTIGALTAQYLLIPSLYLSGDFVDVIRVDDSKTLFYLADVSGHGASSALVTVLLKNMTNRLLRNLRRKSSFDILSPVATLHRINTELLDTGLGKHVSMFLGIADDEQKTLTYAVGGHHPMPILTDEKGGRFLEGRGMPVGLFPEPVFDEQTIPLPDCYQITLFSDGVLEMLADNDMEAKEQRLLKAVLETKGGNPERIKQCVLPDIISDAPDDIAIMTICRQ
ncbi:MAG: hypothetical protein CSA60_00205 [Neptuniibacter caesariensis]|uniref:PPM-type phosphatase domain-containing protein n=1 Tax=Neptuniibacter caesariensis TaxID=207954 RepID=A0A2G6JSF9_NEPCE|nr:MAG: hypothetical protein CSA60_00205 [Neptuniibacter caesariensis]